MNRTRLKVMLVKHEGLRLHPYRDTVGKLTIGVGRNLDDRGLTEDEAMVMLDRDINEALHVCESVFLGFDTLSEPRQHALLDMAFNLGEPRLRGFTKMIAAVEARDFEKARTEMLDSKWAKQVGQRAQTLADMVWP